MEVKKRMAYCRTITTIKNEQHLIDALNYISNPQKSFQVTYVNQTVIENDMNNFDIARQYRLTRIAYNKNKDILSHHFVQSFDKFDNVSPELAHKIGIEFIEKNLSKYQVTLSTHTDKEHIHNHYIINSVSPADGMKFQGNLTILRVNRKSSDELCYKYGLNVIEKGSQSKYKGLDRETLECAKQGKSWKIQLVKDLDEAFEKCSNKKEFIKYFSNKNYDIKFTNKNITFKKQGFDKGIRADTLSKQFGNKYCKASIEEKLGIGTTYKKKQETKSIIKDEISKYEYARLQHNKFAVSEWKRQEKINQRNYYPYNYSPRFNKVFFAKNPLDFTVRLITYMFISRRYKAPVHPTESPKRYKVNSYCNYKNKKQFVSNINYKTLINTPGNTSQIKLYSWQLAKLLDNNILFASKVDLTTGTALVTVKNFDIKRIANILNIEPQELQKQSSIINYRKIKYQIKQQEAHSEYLVITTDQLSKLKYYSSTVNFTTHSSKENGKVTIEYSSNDKNKLLSILFPHHQNENKDSFYLQNVKINRKLKEISKETGEKLCYKILVNSQYAKLKDTGINFAVFKQKDGKYNVVFLESERQKINRILGGGQKKSQPTERKNKNLKK